jgi:hypothetical protein
MHDVNRDLDRFEAILGAELRRYSDARVRPVDPLRIAIAAAGLTPLSPRAWWTRRFRSRKVSVGGAGNRRYRTAALAIVAGLITLASIILVGGTGQPSTRPTHDPSASEVSTPTLSASDLLSGTWDFGIGRWGLDFEASGLDPHPDAALPTRMSIGSALTFTHGAFEGGTGYGGGCDTFRGRFTVVGGPTQISGDLRLDFLSLRQTCALGSPQLIIARLIGTRKFEFSDCVGTKGGPSATPAVFCHSLRLTDSLNENELIYRSGSKTDQ